jgi:hypothetical protein
VKTVRLHLRLLRLRRVGTGGQYGNSEQRQPAVVTKTGIKRLIAQWREKASAASESQQRWQHQQPSA